MLLKARFANKLALVLLCLVVLELVLIGDRVAPVKSLKKKLYLKKLKKLIPLLALVKPKKKILLVPVPIPMFKPSGMESMSMSHMSDTFDMPMDQAAGYEQQQQQQQQQQQYPQSGY